MLLKQIGENIWIYDGTVVQFYGFPYSTRMTVIRLNNNELWIHSPEKLTPALQGELLEFGRVKYLISPNKLHHLFVKEWMSAYPGAKIFAAPGLIEKRKDIQFTKELTDLAESDWLNQIDQLIFRGSPLMEEVVFFHIESKTLLLTDLIENFKGDYFSGWRKTIAKIGGIISPKGKTPLDWRLSFIFGKSRARMAVSKMLDWEPDKIVIAHGECIFSNGKEFIKNSFSWVYK